MEEGAEPEGPAWPDGARAGDVDLSARHASLDIVAPGPVVFGSDVSGWTIVLNNRSNSKVESITILDAVDVELELVGQWSGGTILETPNATIVSRPGGHRCHIILHCDVREVRAHEGMTCVDGQRYLLRPCPAPQNQGRPAPVIEGTAPIKKITGSGPADVRASFVQGTPAKQRRLDDGFSGELTVASPLSGVKLSGDIDLTAEEIAGSNLEVRSLKATSITGSTVSVSARSTMSTAIESHLTVTVPDDVGLVVGRWGGNPGPVTDVITNERDVHRLLRITDDATGTVRRCQVDAPSSDVYVGDLIDSTVEARSLISRSIQTSGETTGATKIHTRTHVQAQAGVELRRGDEVSAGADLVVDGVLRAEALSPEGGAGDDNSDGGAGRGTAGGDKGNGDDGDGTDDGEVRNRAVISAVGTALITGQVVGASLAAKSAIVKQTVTMASVDADRVAIDGSVSRSAVRSREVATIGGDLDDAELDVHNLEWSGTTTSDPATELRLSGDADLPAGFAGTLHWTPASTENTLTVAGAPAAVCVTQAGEPAKLTVTGEAPHWPHLKVDGTARIVAASPANKSTTWHVEHLEFGAKGSTVTIEPNRSVRLESVKVTSDNFVKRDGGSERLTVVVDETSGLHLVAEGGTVAAKIEQDDTVELHAAGSGRVAIHGALRRLNGPKDAGSWGPIIDVPGDAVVHELRGSVRLGQVYGRVEVPIRRDRSKRPRRLSPEAAPVIRGIEVQDPPSPMSTGGYVVGINPAHVPYNELEHARAFHVFEPDPKALLKWAKQDREPHERRSAAASAQRIHDQVRASAASGGPRSAAAWAAARTHHSAAGSWIERVARWFHRWLGYSQRPGPALGTYALLVAAWTVLACLLDLVVDEHLPEHPFWRTPDSLELLGRIALLPVTWLLRVAETDGATTLFTNLAVGVAAFVTIALPFVFLVIAVRNFMAAPDGKSL